MYSINSLQEYIVLLSTKRLLVLRCKKVEQSQCPLRLRATIVKGTSLFEINKYNGPHTCQSLHEPRSSSVRLKPDSRPYRGND